MTKRLRGGHDPSIGKATQIKPGEVRNATGRGGKMKLLTDAYRDKLADIDPRTGQTNAQILANQVFGIARRGKGKLGAIKELREGTEGKATRHVKVDLGLDEKTIQTIAELAGKLL